MWVNLPQRTDWHLFHTLAPWHPKSLLLTAAILHTWWTQLCCYFLSKPGYKMLQESLTESETDQDRIEHLFYFLNEVWSTSWRDKHLTGWWLTYPSKKYESQLGWFFPIYGKIKNVPNHQSVNSAWNQSAKKHQSSGVLFRNVKPHEAAEANHPWSQLHIFPHQNMAPKNMRINPEQSANIEQRYLRYLCFLVNFTHLGHHLGRLYPPLV